MQRDEAELKELPDDVTRAEAFLTQHGVPKAELHAHLQKRAASREWAKRMAASCDKGCGAVPGEATYAHFLSLIRKELVAAASLVKFLETHEPAEYPIVVQTGRNCSYVALFTFVNEISKRFKLLPPGSMISANLLLVNLFPELALHVIATDTPADEQGLVPGSFKARRLLLDLFETDRLEAGPKESRGAGVHLLWDMIHQNLPGLVLEFPTNTAFHDHMQS